jgi:hypothetical protein
MAVLMKWTVVFATLMIAMQANHASAAKIKKQLTQPIMFSSITHIK